MKIKIDLIDPKYNFNQQDVDNISKVNAFFYRPIIVQEGYIPHNYKLISGATIVEILKKYKIPEVEATVLPRDIDQVALREIQVYNNLQRSLSWWEEAILEKRLHEIRVAQHGKSQPGNPHGEKIGWGMRDTARELGISLGRFQGNLKLAEVVELNSALKKIKSREKALEIIKEVGGI